MFASAGSFFIIATKLAESIVLSVVAEVAELDVLVPLVLEVEVCEVAKRLCSSELLFVSLVPVESDWKSGSLSIMLL